MRKSTLFARWSRVKGKRVTLTESIMLSPPVASSSNRTQTQLPLAENRKPVKKAKSNCFFRLHSDPSWRHAGKVWRWPESGNNGLSDRRFAAAAAAAFSPLFPDTFRLTFVPHSLVERERRRKKKLLLLLKREPYRIQPSLDDDFSYSLSQRNAFYFLRVCVIGFGRCSGGRVCSVMKTKCRWQRQMEMGNHRYGGLVEDFWSMVLWLALECSDYWRCWDLWWRLF